MEAKFKCVLHGSFRRHFKEIKEIRRIFTEAGIEVLAPQMSEVKSESDGFVFFESDAEEDKRMVELLYLHNLNKLGENGFSYFVNPEGYLGKSASYELGIAQVSNIRCFFAEKPADHPVYVQKSSIWQAEKLEPISKLLPAAL